LDELWPYVRLPKALPSLADVRVRISDSVRFVQTIRPILGRTPVATEAFSLINLMEARAKQLNFCDRRMDAIAGILRRQVSLLNDAPVLLRAKSFAGGSDLDFVRPPTGARDESYTATQIGYLIETLSDSKRELPLRTTAARILLDITDSRFAIDNEWLSASKDKIRATAMAVSRRESEDDELRKLCLKFLPLSDPDVLAELKTLHARSKSNQVRFAIEERFMEVSDAFYESLHPPGGPVASMVTVAAARECVQRTPGAVLFLEQFRRRFDFARLHKGTRRIVLTNLQTGERVIPKTRRAGFSDGGQSGAEWFELDQLATIPLGVYTLAAEYSSERPSVGYGLIISVEDGPDSKRVSVK